MSQLLCKTNHSAGSTDFPLRFQRKTHSIKCCKMLLVANSVVLGNVSGVTPLQLVHQCHHHIGQIQVKCELHFFSKNKHKHNVLD